MLCACWHSNDMPRETAPASAAQCRLPPPPAVHVRRCARAVLPGLSVTPSVPHPPSPAPSKPALPLQHRLPPPPAVHVRRGPRAVLAGRRRPPPAARHAGLPAGRRAAAAARPHLHGARDARHLARTTVVQVGARRDRSRTNNADSTTVPKHRFSFQARPVSYTPATSTPSALPSIHPTGPTVFPSIRVIPRPSIHA